ncbi:hypothetical protein MTX78_07555 [Hymenobacter tibetensis]|uniref:YceK/YidQ family lipoprotein n=1 Tax=Hymenobacter tibetensis TaxID=497967 RepID=A0ABY4D1N7_9BACT|nr:hypothetical protein [Hymenobacter tibetensis]UOG76446.1 hypothetical protein MTX78_07555 [Hymenobacter tibetensis]
MKTFKKLVLSVAAASVLTSSLSSCATLFGGRVTAYQKTTPAPGQPSREIRVGALVADLLLFWPSLAVDFATSAIYKPQPRAAAPAAPTAAVAPTAPSAPVAPTATAPTAPVAPTATVAPAPPAAPSPKDKRH